MRDNPCSGWFCAFVALAAAGVFCLVGRARADENWWHKDWQYRLKVKLVEGNLRAGINTARVSLAEQSELCMPDGRDVRVVVAGGGVVTHEVALRDNKTFDVLFFAPSDMQQFYIYYGSPEAGKTSHTWGKDMGGLTLETRPISQHVSRVDQIPNLLNRYTTKFGGPQPWPRIADLENPFGRDDMYLAIYEGTIYCPEDGSYAFAVNADDLAAFTIGTGGRPLCWRNPGVPSERWFDRRNPRAVGRIGLRKGIYRLTYHHVENRGAQLAKLGWQTPSSTAIVTVPPEAFVRYVPAEILGREKRGELLCPFFVAKHRFNLRINSERFTFPNYTFESRSGESDQASSQWSYHWDFGDGETASGRSVQHEFPGLRTRDVTLTVTDAAGRQAPPIVRSISPPVQPVEEMKLEMEVESDAAMVLLKEPICIRIHLKNLSRLKRNFNLKFNAERWKKGSRETVLDTESIENLQPAAGQESGWLELERVLPPAGESLYLTLQLSLHGLNVLEKNIALLRTDKFLGELKEDESQNLRDAEGRLVVLGLADVRATEMPPRDLCDPKSGEVKVLLFDEGLAGAVGQQRATYPAELLELLEQRYEGLTFTLLKPRRLSGEQFLPLQKFTAVCRELARSKPNMVIMICEPETVVKGTPTVAYERDLVASLDQVLTQSRAQPLIVTPPPLARQPELARAYGAIAKRIGMRKGVPVADVYSRFMLTEDWPRLFRRHSMRQPSFLLFPNEEGQRILAREIYTTIVGALHQELSAAVRKTAYMREPEP